MLGDGGFQYRHILIYISALSLLVAALACSPGAGHPASGPCANPLLPTSVGATWRYDVSGSMSATFTRSILSVTASGFTDQDLYGGSGAVRTGKWTCAAGNLTRLDLNTGPTAFVDTTRVSMEFQTTDSTGVTLPAQIHPGDSWTQTFSLDGTQIIHGKNSEAQSDVSMPCTAAGTESVTVPAGTFSATRLDCHISQTITVTVGDGPAVPVHLTYDTTDWYAPQVGWVKSTTTGTGINTTVILASYTIP